MKVRILDNAKNPGWNVGDEVDLTHSQVDEWGDAIKLLEPRVVATPKRNYGRKNKKQIN